MSDQVMGRMYNGTCELNSVGRALPDHTPLFADGSHDKGFWSGVASVALAEKLAAEAEVTEQRLQLAKCAEQIEEQQQRHRAEFEACQAAERRVEVLEGLLRRVVNSSVLSFEQDAPEELESLEADICSALKPAKVRCNIPACDYQIDMDQN